MATLDELDALLNSDDFVAAHKEVEFDPLDLESLTTHKIDAMDFSIAEVTSARSVAALLTRTDQRRKPE